MKVLTFFLETFFHPVNSHLLKDIVLPTFTAQGVCLILLLCLLRICVIEEGVNEWN